jgi:hypothetical protein
VGRPSRVWQNWRTALAIVRPETVMAWHRQGFRLFWTWKVCRGKPGRPRVPREVRDLIRQMSRDNPLWGAPHIHGELLKLGITILVIAFPVIAGETSVAKYMVRQRRPPSLTWRTFLNNHAKTLGAHDPVWSRNPPLLKTRGITSRPATAVNPTLRSIPSLVTPLLPRLDHFPNLILHP